MTEIRTRTLQLFAVVALAVGSVLSIPGSAAAAPGPCGYNEYHPGNPDADRQFAKGYWNNCTDHPVYIQMHGVGDARVCAAPHENKYLASLWIRTSEGWLRNVEGATKTADSCPVPV